MKTKLPFQFPLPNPRALIGLVLCLALYPGAAALAQAPQENSGIQVGQSYHNDVSPALRDMAHYPASKQRTSTRTSLIRTAQNKSCVWPPGA